MIKTRNNFTNSLLRRVNSQFGLMSAQYDVYINMQQLSNDNADILYTTSFEFKDLLLIVNFEEKREIQVIICLTNTREYLSSEMYFDSQGDAINFVMNEVELMINTPERVIEAVFDANHKADEEGIAN